MFLHSKNQWCDMSTNKIKQFVPDPAGGFLLQ
jgi:hypothetical protein